MPPRALGPRNPHDRGDAHAPERQAGRRGADIEGVTQPIHRLPYADNAYIEAALSAREGEQPATADGSQDAPHPADATGPCPLCHRERRPAARLGTEELDALQFRFWSADHRMFDHLAFARAVMAACDR